MKQHSLLLALLLLVPSLTGCLSVDAEGSTDAADLPDLSSVSSSLVTALDVPGRFTYGTWKDHYDNRVMASSGVLTNLAQQTTVGTFSCSGSTACPGPSGTWMYGQDTTRSRWVDYTVNGATVRWTLAETSSGRRLLARTLGVTRNQYGQRVPYGVLFLKD